MTNEKLMELVNNIPVTREEFNEIAKLVAELIYIVDKTINPSDEVYDEATKFSEKLEQDRKDKAIEVYKKQLDKLGGQDIFNKFF